MRIDKLTPEQAARFPEWVNKWSEIGLSTEPADFEKATEAALRGYKLANLNRPMVVLRMPSPFAATVGGTMALLMLKEIFGQKVESQVESHVWSQVESQVESQVVSQVRSQVVSQVWSQVWSQVESQVWSQVGSANNNCGNCSLLAAFSAYVSFFRDVCGWQDPVLDRFEINEALIKSCGWTWWHENVLAISDRPAILNRDDQGRLHCETGPSIQYRDGWGMHHIHGVKVDSYIVETPEKITVQLIEAESNAEVRRVMVGRYGQDRYLLDSKAEKIHEDDFGTLYRKELPGDESLVMVKVVNSTPEPDGSFKDYFLRVPPTITRAREGVAWTFGKTEDEYQPALET